jgi:serine/threonine protein kinase
MSALIRREWGELDMRIESFDLPAGKTIARKYRVISKLGSGWEGEVYKVVETRTGIERAAKLLYPHRNIANRTSKLYAKKLHKLRHCPLLIQYHTEEVLTFRRTPITVLISEYVEGELLLDFLKKLPGKRLSPFEGLHLLYALAKGMEQVHLANEYHGDIHIENVIVSRYGLRFDLKLLDLFQLEAPKIENRRSDICDVIRLFYDVLGGSRCYNRHPKAVKYICCGLKTGLILDRFRTMSQLCKHIEMMEW